MSDHKLITVAKNTTVKMFKDGETIATASWQVDGDYPVRLLAGTEGAAPSAANIIALGYEYLPGKGEKGVSIADMWPGLTTANVIFAASEKPTKILFSYA